MMRPAMSKSEEDEDLKELFESVVFRKALKRIADHVATNRKSILSGTLPDADTLKRAQQLRGVYLAFDHLYRSVGVEMPVEFSQGFE